MLPFLLILAAGMGLAYILYTSNTVYAVNVVTEVTFNSITVHNKHEGTFSGDGEYDLVAYVQGKKIDLTYASGPGSGLWDVSNGESLTFKRANKVITEIPNNVPLSIITAGSEVDGCGRAKFPDNIQDSTGFFKNPNRQTTGPIFFDPKLNLQETRYAQDWLNYKTFCLAANMNDLLGTINLLYYPPSYGVGPREAKSNTGDFTLRFTIATGPACNASIC